MAVDTALPDIGAQPADARRDEPAKGILIMLLSLAVFAVLNGVVKDLMQRFPANEIIFFRNAFGLLPLLMLLPWAGGLSILKPQAPFGHVLQALAMSATLVLSYTALGLIPLAEVTAILFLQPTIITVLAHFFLGERGGVRTWASVVIGFAGVLLIVRPTGLGVQFGALAAIAATVFGSIGMLAVRALSRQNASLSISIWYMILSTAIFLPTLFFWWVTPTFDQFVGLGLMGLASGVGQYLMILAFRFAKASTLSPVQYGNLLGAIVVGFVGFGEVPSLATLLGAVVVMAAMALVLPGRKAVLK
jgi:drug/metabolite transporter (DMT)-like permease